MGNCIKGSFWRQWSGKHTIVMLLMSCGYSSSYSRTFGEAANTLFSGATIISKLSWVACIMIGMFLLVGTMVHYREHKRHPKLSPMTTVIVYFTLGLVAFSLPFLSRCFGKDGYDVVHPKYSPAGKYRKYRPDYSKRSKSEKSDSSRGNPQSR